MFAYSYGSFLLASTVGTHSWQDCPWPVTKKIQKYKNTKTQKYKKKTKKYKKYKNVRSYWPLPLALTVGRTAHGQLPETTRNHPS